MTKKLVIVGVSLLITSTVAFAGQDYQQRNVFNKVTDWSATMWKSSAEKQEIINQRIEQRADKRQAYDAYKKKKHVINKDFEHELVSISNENISAEEMARKLKDADSDHRTKLQQLTRDKF